VVVWKVVNETIANSGRSDTAVNSTASRRRKLTSLSHSALQFTLFLCMENKLLELCLSPGRSHTLGPTWPADLVPC
jgi:hypothetical protein